MAGTFFFLEASAQRIVCDENCKLADAPPAKATSTATVTTTTPKQTQASPPCGCYEEFVCLHRE